VRGAKFLKSGVILKFSWVAGAEKVVFKDFS
jgi:hypothetical protein